MLEVEETKVERIPELEIEETKVWRIPEKFVLHELDEEIYWLFDVEDGDYFKLNFASYSMLLCFDGKTPLFKVREKIILRYPEADAQEVCNDLEEFVKKMLKKGILEFV